MKTNQGLKHKHGHMLWVGFVGAAAGAVLMIYVPSLKPVSSVLLFFAGFHVVGAAVLIASLYVMSPHGIVARFLPMKRFRGAARFRFRLGSGLDVRALDCGDDSRREHRRDSGCGARVLAHRPGPYAVQRASSPEDS